MPEKPQSVEGTILVNTRYRYKPRTLFSYSNVIPLIDNRPAPPPQAQPEQTQPEQAQPEQAQPEQAQPEQTQPEQAQSEQTRYGQVRYGQVQTDRVRPNLTGFMQRTPESLSAVLDRRGFFTGESSALTIVPPPEPVQEDYDDGPLGQWLSDLSATTVKTQDEQTEKIASEKEVSSVAPAPAKTIEITPVAHQKSDWDKRVSHRFPFVKLPRWLFTDKGLLPYSSCHTIGLYAYGALLCKSVSSVRDDWSHVALQWNMPIACIKMSQLPDVVGCRTKQQAIEILDTLERWSMVHYYIRSDKVVEVGICDGKTQKVCIAAERRENAACHANAGFVFLRKTVYKRLLLCAANEKQKWSVRDIALDLWISSVFNDEDYPLSVYPLFIENHKKLEQKTSYRNLANRYHCSVGKVYSVLKQLSSSHFCRLVPVHKEGLCIFLPAMGQKYTLPTLSLQNIIENIKSRRRQKRFWPYYKLRILVVFWLAKVVKFDKSGKEEATEANHNVPPLFPRHSFFSACLQIGSFFSRFWSGFKRRRLFAQVE